MDTQDILRRIVGQDYTVQRDVQAAGPAVAPAIVPLLRDPDDDVRALAAHCLAFAGGPVAGHALVGAVSDPSLTVAGAALAGLAKLDLRAMPDVALALLATLGSPLEPVLRRRIPLVLLQGRAALPAEALRPRIAPEADPLVREGLVLLLGLLGDKAARKETADRVLHANGDDMRRWTQVLELVEAAAGPALWLVRPLRAWLDDEEPAKRIGVDGIPNVPQAIRACEVAVNLLVRWTAVRPSFTPSLFALYTPEQRAEVRALVQDWLAAHPELP
jgi:hypothetical protein